MPLSSVQVSAETAFTAFCIAGTITEALLLRTISPESSLLSFSTTRRAQIFEPDRFVETNKSPSACTRPCSFGLSLRGFLSGMRTFLESPLCRFFRVLFVQRYLQYSFPSSLYSHL